MSVGCHAHTFQMPLMLNTSVEILFLEKLDSNGFQF